MRPLAPPPHPRSAAPYGLQFCVRVDMHRAGGISFCILHVWSFAPCHATSSPPRIRMCVSDVGSGGMGEGGLGVSVLVERNGSSISSLGRSIFSSESLSRHSYYLASSHTSYFRVMYFYILLVAPFRPSPPPPPVLWDKRFWGPSPGNDNVLPWTGLYS